MVDNLKEFRQNYVLTFDRILYIKHVYSVYRACIGFFILSLGRIYTEPISDSSYLVCKTSFILSLHTINNSLGGSIIQRHHPNIWAGTNHACGDSARPSLTVLTPVWYANARENPEMSFWFCPLYKLLCTATIEWSWRLKGPPVMAAFCRVTVSDDEHGCAELWLPLNSMLFSHDGQSATELTNL